MQIGTTSRKECGVLQVGSIWPHEYYSFKWMTDERAAASRLPIKPSPGGSRAAHANAAIFNIHLLGGELSPGASNSLRDMSKLQRTFVWLHVN